MVAAGLLEGVYRWNEAVAVRVAITLFLVSAAVFARGVPRQVALESVTGPVQSYDDSSYTDGGPVYRDMGTLPVPGSSSRPTMSSRSLHYGSYVASKLRKKIPTSGDIVSDFTGDRPRSFVFNPDADPEVKFQECTTSRGESGHCRYVQHCNIPAIVGSFQVFLQHVCLIGTFYVGVCCPEQPAAEDMDGPSGDSVEQEIRQSPEGCGLTPRARIVGGTVANPKEWIWMAALMGRGRVRCGGALINNWYVLTAAHCTLGYTPSGLRVLLGEYGTSDTGRDFIHNIPVAVIKRHPEFTTMTYENDIALLKLAVPVRFDQHAGTICLPQPDDDFVGREGTVVGWGTVVYGGATSDVLRQVTVPVWSNEDCNSVYFANDIKDVFLCAGSKSGGSEDACQGDSGGPLMLLNSSGRWTAIGIVSWGRHCGEPGYPGVYTRVTEFLDWIDSNSR